YDDEMANAQMCQAALKAVRAYRTDDAVGPALKGFQLDAAEVRKSHPHAGAWLGFSLEGDGVMERFLSRISGAEIQRELLVAAIELKRYQIKHGAVPSELAMVVPEVTSQVPADPIDGKPLRYRSNSDGSFLLYSVGEDGVDNGGDSTLPHAASSSVTYRQWWKGRDAVWSLPAGPEEIQSYFAKLAAERKATPGALERRFRDRYGLVKTNVPTAPSR